MESQVVTVIFARMLELKPQIVFVMLIHLSPAIGYSLDRVTEEKFGKCCDAAKMTHLSSFEKQ